MPKQTIKRIFVFLTVVIALVIGAVVIHDPIFMDSQEIRYPGVFVNLYSSTGSYKFNPETIIKNIAQGKKNIFNPPDESPSISSPSTALLSRQSDYLVIANALHEQIWGDSTNNWDLHDMSFYGDCEHDPIGFDIVNVTYYKPTGFQQYSAHMVLISPLSGDIEWGGETNFPRSIFEKWKYIDLEKIKITVEETLVLAEKNGGMEARLAVANECRIYIALSPYPSPEWSVDYSHIRNSSWVTLFEMNIDAYTGNYKILKPDN